MQGGVGMRTVLRWFRHGDLSMGTVLGCIADDFTGATDLAGILARSGVRVSLRIGVPARDDPDPAPFEVIALKCRTVPVADAVRETGAALSWLERTGAPDQLR